MRPQSLAEVARKTAEGASFDLTLADFLDGFYPAPKEEALSQAPELLAPKLGEAGRVKDAYLAATAEQLACDNGFPIPSWVVGEERTLHRPWFASPLGGLRAVLIHESPPVFRARNLFVSANALERA